MAKKGIEEMISEIEIFIDNCKYKPLSSSSFYLQSALLKMYLHFLQSPLHLSPGLWTRANACRMA